MKKSLNKNGLMAMQKVIDRSQSEEIKAKLPAVRKFIQANRNDLGFCPMCDRKIADREESIYAELISDLYKVYQWCGEHRRHEFEMKDIRHLLSKVNYARFGNLDHYGGIVYKPAGSTGRDGHFGINMARAKEFFAGERDIPLSRTVSLISGETVGEVRGTIRDIPALRHFLDQDGRYDPDAPVHPHKKIISSKERQEALAAARQRVDDDFDAGRPF